MAYTLQEYNTTTNTGLTPSSSTFHFGQTFLAGSSYTLTKVELLMFRVGTPPNITVEIQTTTSGLPNNTVLTTQSIDVSTITTDSAGEEVAIVFDTPASLTSGITYAIVVANGYTDNSNRYYWRLNTATDSYANGTRVYASNGTTWSAGTYDADFKNYSGTSGNVWTIEGSISGTTTVIGITGVSRLVISTINGVCVVSGVLSKVLIPLIGTITGTSGCVAVILIGRVTITDVIIYKRLVVIGNNQVYYEVL